MSNNWCFVIGPIGEAGSETRKKADLLLELVLRPVLAPLGFDPIKRADDDAEPGSITAALIKDVLEAPLVVADLSGFNPNAFYELGIRHGAQLPTIHITTEQVALPFDNKDQRTIFVDLGDYNSIVCAKTRLENAAARTLESDYSVSNPVTQSKALFELGKRQDPRDEVLAAFDERMARVERAVVSLSDLPSLVHRSALDAYLERPSLGSAHADLLTAAREALSESPSLAATHQAEWAVAKMAARKKARL